MKYEKKEKKEIIQPSFQFLQFKNKKNKEMNKPKDDITQFPVFAIEE